MLTLTTPDPVTISGPDAGFFSVATSDTSLPPRAAGAITLACWAFIPSNAPTGFTRFFSAYLPGGFGSQGWGAGYGTRSRMLGTPYGRFDYFSPNMRSPSQSRLTRK